MPIPDWCPGEAPRHSIMTIVARRGWCVINGRDAVWAAAWMYSHHGTDAYSGDLMVVTEHGWADFMTGWGGPEPRLEA